MPKASKAKKAETEVENTVHEAGHAGSVNAETKTPKKADRHSVTVNFNGQSRVYSREVHGDDFEALAEEFVSKDPDHRAIA